MTEREILVKSDFSKLCNYFKGESVVILSCGPSLNEYSKEKIINFCKNKKIFCIKDSINLFGDVCDIFIANQHRDKEYIFSEKKRCLRFYQKDFLDPQYNKYDIILENENCFRYGTINNDLDVSNIKFNSKREKNKFLKYDNYHAENVSKSDYLLSKKNFEDYNFNNKFGRPRGPGILYESAFYLCLYLGFKNAYTIGWDLNITGNTHFNNNSKTNKYIEEFIFVNENIESLYNYFLKEGLFIRVVGNVSYINKAIPRLLL